MSLFVKVFPPWSAWESSRPPQHSPRWWRLLESVSLLDTILYGESHLPFTLPSCQWPTLFLDWLLSAALLWWVIKLELFPLWAFLCIFEKVCVHKCLFIFYQIPDFDQIWHGNLGNISWQHQFFNMNVLGPVRTLRGPVAMPINKWQEN